MVRVIVWVRIGFTARVSDSCHMMSECYSRTEIAKATNYYCFLVALTADSSESACTVHSRRDPPKGCIVKLVMEVNEEGAI